MPLNIPLTIGSSTALVANGLIQLLANGQSSLTIPINCTMLEVSITATYENVSSATPATSFRPCFSLANPIPKVNTSWILNPLGISTASSMTGASYSVTYNIAIPIPKSYATGLQAIQLQISPETNTATPSASTGWNFTSFLGSVRGFA